MLVILLNLHLNFALYIYDVELQKYDKQKHYYLCKENIYRLDN